MANTTVLTPSQRRQLYKAAYPIARAPHGGMGVNSKSYLAGQFLPGRRTYALDTSPELSMPPRLSHNHLRTLDLHKVEPTWHKQGGRNTYGGVIFNRHGHVLLVEPTNHYYGYHWTFPKGGNDPGEHPVDTALREVKEETGHDASIVGLVPHSFPRPTGPQYTGGPIHGQYFVMQSHGQTSKPDFETASTRWASPEDAHDLIDQSTNIAGKLRDHDILNRALSHFKLLQTQPESNKHLQPHAGRQTYSKVKSCDGHCSCTKCAAGEALNRVIYSRACQYQRRRIQRLISYR